jgi:hypothetical protein
MHLFMFIYHILLVTGSKPEELFCFQNKIEEDRFYYKSYEGSGNVS